ncbi:hypothetical protein NW752_000676 [Fusarium irregulare]|uniref:Small secreted protein n=1 Tax=Fusarium irregulare TaxID=2494466 RepID=A0A9W8PZG2_9HYPO|nr:hypothetical protein NW766_001155 [Fusarium irregulare]KAJ4028419.1 hypothetical protein NW752_000676 [Fusarium irregulare]
MYPFATFTSLLAIAGAVSATLEPAKSNTKGQYPRSPACSPSKTSNAIQAAECAYNTRVSGKQTFAIFKVDHQYDQNNGAPYGTCEAYECDAPASGDMTADEDYWTFFWNNNGESSGVGTTCIKDPNDGTCGCENSDGTFIPGGKNCV